MYPNDAEVRRILLGPISPEWEEACKLALEACKAAVESGELEQYEPPDLPYEAGKWPWD